ncbi:hypothetical protein CHS0354_018023 [Potamilus streckersoni]|uniref:Ubiquitin-like protein ATG12 n=1 Tax=Potamilus streckersoni TaxID=2493646 RepID=A0AAE0RNB1_9BIVA|nr:hypothetical protein CHS0354_018023 [Potamilus streckersoni]
MSAGENVESSENALKETADSEKDAKDTEPTPPDVQAISPHNTYKIDLLLKAAGDAPIMKKKKWAVERNKTVYWVADFIKKYLKCQQSDSLFIYVNQSFAPAPDSEIGTVFDCFGSDGKLVLHYCKTQAWG